MYSQRPWYELESNYAIMFKVGMGEVPPTPPTLSEEGQVFLSHLLQHDPKQRETAANLLEHNFLKVRLMLEYSFIIMFVIYCDFFRFTKRMTLYTRLGGDSSLFLSLISKY